MAPLPLIPNLVTRWCHLNWFQIWSPDGITCISSKFGHQMAPLALVTIALPHCLGLSYWLYQLVLSWYLHQSESHQLSLNKVLYSVTSGQIIISSFFFPFLHFWTNSIQDIIIKWNLEVPPASVLWSWAQERQRGLYQYIQDKALVVSSRVIP